MFGLLERVTEGLKPTAATPSLPSITRIFLCHLDCFEKPMILDLAKQRHSWTNFGVLSVRWHLSCRAEVESLFCLESRSIHLRNILNLLISYICYFGRVPRLVIIVYVLRFDLDWIPDISISVTFRLHVYDYFLCAEFGQLDSPLSLYISWERLFSLESLASSLYLTLNFSDDPPSRRNCSFYLISWTEQIAVPLQFETVG